MKIDWNNLNERERWLVVIGGIVCFFYLFYMVLYAPITRRVQERTLQRLEKQETLAWMEQVRNQRVQVVTKRKPLSQGQFLTLLSNQLAQTTLKVFPHQLQQIGSDEVQVSFEQVSFQSLVLWLDSLTQSQAVSVKQFEAEQLNSPGLVKASVVFTFESA